MIIFTSKKNIKGQTLLEIVITVAVISIALISLMQLVLVSYMAGSNARYKGYATYLVQDAADIVTNIRDTSIRRINLGESLTPWSASFYDGTHDGFYTLDTYSNTTGWALINRSTESSAPCYNCSSTPIYPATNKLYLFDDQNSAMDSKTGDRSRDVGNTEGLKYLGVSFYRYVYIEKYQGSADILHIRIIVSWQENGNLRSVGQDLLLTNLSKNGYII